MHTHRAPAPCSAATLLARLEGIIGPVPAHMLDRGRFTHKFYTKSGRLYEKNQHTVRRWWRGPCRHWFLDARPMRMPAPQGQFEILRPKKSSLRARVPHGDDGFLEFVAYLLAIDPERRPTAVEALTHPWLNFPYPDPATLEV